MKQGPNISLIKRIIKKRFPDSEVRFIKIHGSKYQEAGIPDILCLVQGEKNYWLEVKRNWKDRPTKLQKWNVESLRKFGFITGFVAGDKYKKCWSDKIAIKLEDVL